MVATDAERRTRAETRPHIVVVLKLVRGVEAARTELGHDARFCARDSDDLAWSADMSRLYPAFCQTLGSSADVGGCFDGIRRDAFVSAHALQCLGYGDSADGFSSCHTGPA